MTFMLHAVVLSILLLSPRVICAVCSNVSGFGFMLCVKRRSTKSIVAPLSRRARPRRPLTVTLKIICELFPGGPLLLVSACFPLVGLQVWQ